MPYVPEPDEWCYPEQVQVPLIVYPTEPEYEPALFGSDGDVLLWWSEKPATRFGYRPAHEY